MKSLVSRFLMVGVALAGVTAVEAQSRTIKADVPFRFYMGSTAMPQGTYRVDELYDGAVIQLTTANEAKAITSMPVRGKGYGEQPRLVFHRYGDAYFLSAIWDGVSDMGREISVSAREKELARNGNAPVIAVIRLAIH